MLWHRIVCSTSLNQLTFQSASGSISGFKTGGRLQMSDSIATRPIPAHLQDAAPCLSGALTYEQYIQRIVDAGFGQKSARRPYRLLDRYTYNLEDHLP